MSKRKFNYMEFNYDNLFAYVFDADVYTKEQAIEIYFDEMCCETDSIEDVQVEEEYEKLLDKGYCDCNEMNCIDNNAPRRILNIAKELKEKLENKNKVIKETIFKTKCVKEHEFDRIGRYEILDILNKGVDDK